MNSKGSLDIRGNSYYDEYSNNKLYIDSYQSSGLSTVYTYLERGEKVLIKSRVTEAIHENYCLDQCPLMRCDENSKECLMKHVKDALNI